MISPACTILVDDRPLACRIFMLPTEPHRKYALNACRRYIRLFSGFVFTCITELGEISMYGVHSSMCWTNRASSVARTPNPSAGRMYEVRRTALRPKTMGDCLDFRRDERSTRFASFTTQPGLGTYWHGIVYGRIAHFLQSVPARDIPLVASFMVCPRTFRFPWPIHARSLLCLS